MLFRKNVLIGRENCPDRDAAKVPRVKPCVDTVMPEPCGKTLDQAAIVNALPGVGNEYSGGVKFVRSVGHTGYRTGEEHFPHDCRFYPRAAECDAELVMGWEFRNEPFIVGSMHVEG